MKPRYVLAPEAALDLVEIWRYINEQTGMDMAERVESVIRDRIGFLAGNPDLGHSRSGSDGPAGEILLGIFLPDRLPP